MENNCFLDCESLYKNKQVEQSIKYFDDYFKTEKKTIQNFRKKGIFSINLKKYDDALLIINNILKISPEDSNFLSRKGMILALMGNNEEALFFLDQALNYDSKNYLTLINKAIVMINLENYDDAISILDEILKLCPNDFTAINTKGYALEKLGKNDESVLLYLTALEIEPQDSHELYKLIYHFIHFLTNKYDLNDKNWDKSFLEKNIISSESKTFLKNQHKIMGIYQNYLSRNPDVDGMEYFSDKLLQGKSLEWVENEIKNSDELKLLISKRKSEFKIIEFYQNYLSRNPDVDGMEYFSDKLLQGKSLEWVENEIKNSDEKKDTYFLLD